MDSVRFGRVLGVGARLAGKTLAQAIDAAASPNPAWEQKGAGEVISPGREAGVRVGQQTRATTQGVRRGGRRFGDAVWSPFARASGVLLLEVTGVFFGLVAVAGLDGMWLNRGAMHWGAAGSDVRLHFMIAAGLAVAFGYFCVSSFVKAARRERR